MSKHTLYNFPTLSEAAKAAAKDLLPQFDNWITEKAVQWLKANTDEYPEPDKYAVAVFIGCLESELHTEITTQWEEQTPDTYPLPESDPRLD